MENDYHQTRTKGDKTQMKRHSMIQLIGVHYLNRYLDEKTDRKPKKLRK